MTHSDHQLRPFRRLGMAGSILQYLGHPCTYYSICYSLYHRLELYLGKHRGPDCYVSRTQLIRTNITTTVLCGRL